MKLTHIALVGSLAGWVLLSGCTSGRAESTPATAAEDKDREVRVYIEDALVPYLDSLAYQLCEVKSVAAPTAKGQEICPSAGIGYKHPPTDGAP